MSTGYNPKNEITAQQALKVQELVISDKDPGLYQSASNSTCIMIREPIDKVYLVRFKDDSSNLFVEFDQAHISIVDSESLLTAEPNDRGAIKVGDLVSLSANDVIHVRYSVKED